MHGIDALCDTSPISRCEVMKNAGSNTKSCIFRAKSIRKPVISDWFNGADGRIRTGDLILTKDALYLLSYISASILSPNANIIILLAGRKSNAFSAKMTNLTLVHVSSIDSGHPGPQGGFGQVKVDGPGCLDGDGRGGSHHIRDDAETLREGQAAEAERRQDGFDALWAARERGDVMNYVIALF